MLFVRLHVLADHYPVAAATTSIKAGQVVALNASGEVVLVDNNNAAPSIQIPIGIAGDNIGTLAAKQFSNKAWELGDETAGSGKVTVYYGGGSFYIDYGGNGLDVCEESSLAPGNVLGTDNACDDGKVKLSYGGTAIFRVENVLTSTSGYLDSGIPGPVYQPVGDVDSARKFALVTLLI